MNKKERNNIGNLYGDIPDRKPAFKPTPAFTIDVCEVMEEMEVALFKRPRAASVRENAHQELPDNPTP